MNAVFIFFFLSLLLSLPLGEQVAADVHVDSESSPGV